MIQFGLLDQMQNELDRDFPELDIQLLGVNRDTYDYGNEAMTSGKDIPWLQDVDDDGDSQSDAWISWEVTFRDLVILNAKNERVGVFNLTLNPLEFPQNYDSLRQMLIDAALAPPDPFLVSVANGEWNAEGTWHNGALTPTR